MTTHRFASTAVLVLVALSLTTVACTGSGDESPGADRASTAVQAEPSTTARPSPPETASDLPSTEAPLEPSVEPSRFAGRSEPAITEPPIPEPPAATLAVEGGDPVVGELGSYAWMNSGSAAPWLPGAPIHIGHGERLTLKLADPVRLANWTVARTPAATFGSGVIGIGEGSSQTVSFAAPPQGSWSLNVSVWFAGNLGSAAYYWLVTVD